MMFGSAATEGVEGDRDALGGSSSPLQQEWCRFCGSSLLLVSDYVFPMCCQPCFKSITEISVEQAFGDRVPAFADLTPAVEKAVDHFQKFADHMSDLARRTTPVPDSPLSPYQANQGRLTLDALGTEVQKLRQGSASGIDPQGLKGSLRGPVPDAVFHDEFQQVRFRPTP